MGEGQHGSGKQVHSCEVVGGNGGSGGWLNPLDALQGSLRLVLHHNAPLRVR